MSDVSTSTVASSDSATACPWSEPQWRRRVVLVLIVLLVAWFSRFAYLRMTRGPTPRPEYWAERIAELDPPGDGALGMDELLTVFAPTPEMNDPAILSRFGTWIGHIDGILNGQWDDSHPRIKAATEIFEAASYAEANQQIRQAVERSWYEPMDPGQLGYLSAPRFNRAWAHVLLAHSRWVRMQSGDVAAAIDDWLTALGVSRGIQRSCRYYSLYGAFRANDLVALEMMRAAREGCCPTDTAALGRRIDGLLGPELRPSQLLEGERLHHHCLLEKFYVRDGGDWLDVSAATWSLNQPVVLPSRLWNLASPLYHDLPTARQALDDWVQSTDQWTDLAAIQHAGRSTAALLQQPPGAIDGFLFGDNVERWLQPVKQYYISRCQLEAAVTMLGLEAFRAQHGRYPERLSELVPRYLHRLPVDYGDRRPLRYRRAGEDYVLYSIGGDGKDESGAAARQPWDFDDPNARDIVFSSITRMKIEQ